MVGAYRNDLDENFQNTVNDAGAIYIYYNNNGAWEFFQKIVSPLRTENQMFGTKVKIIDDYIFVGVPFNKYDENELNSVNTAGAVYVYKNNGINWAFFQKIVAPNRHIGAQFGKSIDKSGDLLFIGASEEKNDQNNANTINGAGASYIYQLNSGQYHFVQEIVAPDRSEYDRFGYSVSGSNQFLIVGAATEDEDENGINTLHDAGSAYIFKNDAGNWVFFQKIVQPDRTADKNFGDRMEINDTTLIIAVSLEDKDVNGNNSLTQAGALYHYKYNGIYWDFFQKFTPSDRSYGANFGTGLSIENNMMIIGASNTNKVYVLNFDNFLFSQPEDVTVCENSQAKIGLISNEAQTYQWQIKYLAGWFNIYDNETYQSTNSDTLSILNIPHSFNNNQYRCILSNGILTKYTVKINLFVDTNIVALAGDNQILCNLDEMQLSGNNPDPNTGFWTSSNSQIVFEDSLIYNTTVSNLPLEQTVFTWHINNGICGISQSEITTIFDTISPYLDIATLPDIIAECEVTSLTAPTATDNCAGTINGTHNATLPIIAQGTTTVTWTYDDGNGNTSTQTQNVVIDDITNPTITCIGNQIINLAQGETFYIVSGTEFDPISTDDNCGIASVLNSFNSLVTLENAQLPTGTTTITWSVTDIGGNTSNCQFDVTVNFYVGINNLAQNGISIYPNPVLNELIIEIKGNKEKTDFKILNSNVQVVFKGNLSEKTVVQTRSFSPGAYLIKLENEKTYEFKKIIKE